MMVGGSSRGPAVHQNPGIDALKTQDYPVARNPVLGDPEFRVPMFQV
jgi:hypothetical protein